VFETFARSLDGYPAKAYLNSDKVWLEEFV
jgi:hypothetical protein